jgi:hypothetical protein
LAHEFLRRDIAEVATEQSVEMSPRKWKSNRRKRPISIWMQEQEGRCWYTRRGEHMRSQVRRGGQIAQLGTRQLPYCQAIAI